LKLLFLDIESYPNVSYTWGLWQQNVAPSQLVKAQEVASWAAKWYGNPEVFFDSVHHSSKKHMLKGVHKLLDETDAVVHYYGSKFDIPMLNTEFVKAGMLPPSPYKQIDLKKVTSDKFKFPSTKLEHVGPATGAGSKIKTDFDLWKQCMAGNDQAWELMKTYNIQDVQVLENLYEVYRPWITNHPNWGAYQDDKKVCPACGSLHVQKRGMRHTAKLLTYQQLRCMECGTWFRSNVTLTPKGIEKYVGI
jgi:hypothetical protein